MRTVFYFLIYTLHKGGGWSISLLFNPPYYFLVYFIFVLLMGRAFFGSVAKSERLMSRVGGEDELFSLKGSNVITLFFFWTIQQGFRPRTIFDFFRLSRAKC